MTATATFDRQSNCRPNFFRDRASHLNQSRLQSDGGELYVIGRGSLFLFYCWFHVLRFSVLSSGNPLSADNPHIPISGWFTTPAPIISCWPESPGDRFTELGTVIPTALRLFTAVSQHHFSGRGFSPKNANQQLFIK